MTVPIAAPSKTDELLRQVGLLVKVATQALEPEPLRIYKPFKDGTGTALKVDLRLQPVFNDRGYIKAVDGGLYLELVPQVGRDESDNATFGWEDTNRRVVTKFGKADILAVLTAMRCRWARRTLPVGYGFKEDRVALLHKTDAGVTAIEYSLQRDSAGLRMSKSKEHALTIKLTLPEELDFETYLLAALQQFHRFGKR